MIKQPGICIANTCIPYIILIYTIDQYSRLFFLCHYGIAFLIQACRSVLLSLALSFNFWQKNNKLSKMKVSIKQHEASRSQETTVDHVKAAVKLQVTLTNLHHYWPAPVDSRHLIKISREAYLRPFVFEKRFTGQLTDCHPTEPVETWIETSRTFSRCKNNLETKCTNICIALE